MAATFRTRPWLLAPAPSPSVPRLLVGATRRPPAPGATGQTRSYAKRIAPQMRSQVQHHAKVRQKQPATSTVSDDMLAKSHALNPAQYAFVAPGTIVPLSLSAGWQLLRSNPRLCLKYCWKVLRQKLADRLLIFQLSLKTRGGLLAKYRRSDFKPTRKGVADVGADLHASMSRFVASGTPNDMARLARICTPKLYASLNAIVQGRPPGQSYSWQRVELLQTRFWPRVVDFKWVEMPLGPGLVVTSRQAVVAVKSRQRLTRRNEQGEAVGTPTERDLTEYVLLWRVVEKDTQTLGPWLVHGTLKETSPEELFDEIATMEGLSRMHARSNLEETRKQKESGDRQPTAGSG